MHRLVFVTIVILLGSWLPAATAQAQATPPISLHPENGHYFLWRGEPTVLITSAEHYGAVLNLEFDYVRYLDELQAQGLNHTRTFSGVYREIPGSFGITQNTLAPQPSQYSCPWLRSDQPGYYDGGNRFDLTQWDPEYFARLKDFLRQASQRGVVVEINLFCPFYKDELWLASPMNIKNNVNGIGDCPREEVYTLKHEELLNVHLAVTRKIVSELREFDNLYYEICNEPYFGGVTQEWQHRIVDEIQAVERSFSHQHLISLNVANGRKKIEDPHPGVSIFNFHYCHPPDVVAMNYSLNKVIGENETGFRGQDDLLYRTEGWDFLLAGGAIYNNLDYSFTPNHPDGSLEEYDSPGGGSAALRTQLRVLKDFIEGFDLPRLRPVSNVIHSVSDSLVASALGDPGREYAVYLHVPLPDKANDLASYRRSGLEADIHLNLSAGTYLVVWVNTKTGEEERREDVRHEGSILQLQSPPFDDDIALRVRRSE